MEGEVYSARQDPQGDIQIAQVQQRRTRRYQEDGELRDSRELPKARKRI